MSVGSLIGYEKNGVVHSVYCYECGEPEETGQTLLENYNLGNIEDLIAIGDFHKLEHTVEETKEYVYGDEYEDAPSNVRDYASTVEFFADDEEDNDWFYLLDEDGNWYVFN